MAKRLMGLDVGNKRIGVAISDVYNLTAQPYMTIHRKNAKDDLQRFARILDEYQIGTIVVGLPKNMDGTIGEQGRRTQAFAESLQEIFDGRIVFYDERLSSSYAKKIMHNNQVKKNKKKEIIDTIAAVIILEGYMTGKEN